MTVLRSALFNAWFFGVTVLLGLLGLALRWLAPHRALPLARRWARLVVAGARLICGIEVEVTGLERLPPGPLLVASQHQSAFDTLIWAVLLPRFAYVYKAELARIPLFGSMLRASGQIPVDRTGSVTAMRKLLRATQEAKAAGRQIVIFPEGTRVAIDTEAPIRAGFAIIAARTALPIYPVATDSGRCWGRRAFTKRAGTIHVHVGEPIASDLPSAQLTETLRARWRAAGLGVKPVDKVVDVSVAPCPGAAPNPSVSGVLPPRAGRQEVVKSGSRALSDIGK